MSLEKEIKDFLNSSYGTKNIRGDYTTNSQSYYDFLEKVIPVLMFMSKKIDEYDGVLSSELQKLKNTLDEYIEKWDKNLEDFPEDVELLLNQWLIDGTLETVLSDALLQTKSNIVLSRTEPTHINEQTYWFQIKSTENIIDLDDNISFEILT